MAKSIAELLNCKSVAELIQILGKSVEEYYKYDYKNAESILASDAVKDKNPLVVRLLRLVVAGDLSWEKPFIPQVLRFNTIDIIDITPSDLKLNTYADFYRSMSELKLYYKHKEWFKALEGPIITLEAIMSLSAEAGVFRPIFINFLIVERFQKATSADAAEIFLSLKNEELKKIIAARITSLQDVLQVVGNFVQLNNILKYIDPAIKTDDPDFNFKVTAKSRELIKSVTTLDDLSAAIDTVDTKSCKSAIIKVIFNDVDFINEQKNNLPSILDNASVKNINTLGKEKLRDVFSCFSIEELIAATKSKGHARRLFCIMLYNEVGKEKNQEFKLQLEQLSSKYAVINASLQEELLNFSAEDVQFKTMIWELAKFDEYSASDIASAIAAHYRRAQISAPTHSSLFGSWFGSTTQQSQPQTESELRSSTSAAVSAAATIDADLAKLVTKFASKK